MIAQTVLERFNGARAFYSTLIKRGEDVLAEVQSSWCCIDAKTLRPARLSAIPCARFLSPHRPRRASGLTQSRESRPRGGHGARVWWGQRAILSAC